MDYPTHEGVLKAELHTNGSIRQLRENSGLSRMIFVDRRQHVVPAEYYFDVIDAYSNGE